MHNLDLTMLATNTIFIDQVLITLSKLHVTFKPHPLRDFVRRGGRTAKNAYCINP